LGRLKDIGRLGKGGALANAKKIGFRPGSIIDVGFAVGTEGLYGVFEGARHVLIDAIAETEPVMKRFCDEHPGSIYFIAAVSDQPGQVEIVSRPGVTGSTIHGKVSPGAELRRVRAMTLDQLIAEHDLPRPYLLKLDIEGHEMHALRGAKRCLQDTEMAIIEIGTWAEDNPGGRASMMDVFRFMDDQGFVFYDLVEPGYRPVDDALYMFDAIFVKRDSMLRSVRSQKSPEQAAAAREHKQARIEAALAAAREPTS
jgi:FkbM family methyltransferase